EKAAKLLNRLLGAKWRPDFAAGIEHGRHPFLVGNRQRETVTCATRWVDERAVDVAPVIRPLSNVRIDTGFNAFRGDERLDVSSKFGAIFCSSPNRVFFVFLVKKLLR